VKLHHVAILVTDLERAEAFYAGVLGLPVIRRAEGRSFWVGAPDENAFLAVEKAEPQAVAAARLPCLALTISAAERETWRARLGAAGVALDRDKETPHTIYFRDPDGNVVALSHWPDPV
jgi:glyoxylase I family protein